METGTERPMGWKLLVEVHTGYTTKCIQPSLASSQYLENSPLHTGWTWEKVLLPFLHLSSLIPPSSFLS